MRIEEDNRPIVTRGEPFEIDLAGIPTKAFAGETVASVMLANGVRSLRSTRGGGDPRGFFCGIGVCFDCLVIVDGKANVRACMTRVAPGMKVHPQDGIGAGGEG